MDSDSRTGLRRIAAPEQAEHLALKEYTTIKLMQVVAERDAAVVEREDAFAERKSALNERDAAFLQRDIAVAERDAAIIERDNAFIALDAARGHRTASWNNYKRQADIRGKDILAMQMGLPNTVAFGVEELHTLSPDASLVGFVGNSDRVQPVQRRNCRSQEKQGSKSKRCKKISDVAGAEVPKSDVKNKSVHSQEHGAHVQEAPEEVLPLVRFGVQDSLQQLPKSRVRQSVQECKESDNVAIINTPIPHCSCTGVNQPCYRWGNGGWQSACCTTTMSVHPLPMNPKKRGYRLPGRKMSAGAFQKLVKRLSQEGVDLLQPIDLKDYWAKHGTNSIDARKILEPNLDNVGCFMRMDSKVSDIFEARPVFSRKKSA